jgi:3-phosphoshikimate 1-carboxyvinyltransferase
VEYVQPQASAQVKSCLLLAGLLADGNTTVVEPTRSRDHTERMLVRAGVQVSRADGAVTVCNVDELGLDAIEVPGDLSSASFLIAAGLIVHGSRLVLERVGVNWTRTGFLDIARRMGGVVLGDLEDPPPDDEIPTAEPVSELDVSACPLVATTVEPHEVPRTIDELPLVALLGCFAEGETVVRGASELRIKESDRLQAVVEGLRGLGADIEATDDGFAVRGTGGLEGGVLDSHGDHRLAMLGAVAGLASRDGVRVVGIDVAAVSYPQFREHLGTLA